MKTSIIIFLCLLFLSNACKNAEKTANQTKEKPNKPAFSPYIQPIGIKRQWAQGANVYDVKKILPPANINGKVKNVILLIGDGMGLAQIYAAMTAVFLFPIGGNTKAFFGFFYHAYSSCCAYATYA